MDTASYTKQSGQFLKADVVSKNPNVLFQIVDEGKFVKSEKFGTDRLHIMLKLADDEFTFDCSKTNARTIEKALGTESKNWIGHYIVLESYKTKTSDGKMVDAINVKEEK